MSPMERENSRMCQPSTIAGFLNSHAATNVDALASTPSQHFLIRVPVWLRSVDEALTHACQRLSARLAQGSAQTLTVDRLWS